LTNEMLTGVESIDEQHRMIFDLGNNFIDPYTMKAGVTLFQDALVFLADYIAYHLASEEFSMKEANYPDYEIHRRWHGLFSQQMADYVKRSQRREMSVRSNNCLIYRVKVPSGELSVHLGSSRERRLSNQGS